MLKERKTGGTALFLVSYRHQKAEIDRRYLDVYKDENIRSWYPPQTGLCMYHYQTLDNAGAIMVAIGKSSATGFERMMHRNSLRAVPCGLRPQNELAPVPSLHYIACSENYHSPEAISIFGQVEVNAVVW